MDYEEIVSYVCNLFWQEANEALYNLEHAFGYGIVEDECLVKPEPPNEANGIVAMRDIDFENAAKEYIKGMDHNTQASLFLELIDVVNC